MRLGSNYGAHASRIGEGRVGDCRPKPTFCYFARVEAVGSACDKRVSEFSSNNQDRTSNRTGRSHKEKAKNLKLIKGWKRDQKNGTRKETG